MHGDVYIYICIYIFYYIYIYQHLPRGANSTLRDGKLTPISNHLTPTRRFRYKKCGKSYSPPIPTSCLVIVAAVWKRTRWKLCTEVLPAKKTQLKTEKCIRKATKKIQFGKLRYISEVPLTHIGSMYGIYTDIYSKCRYIYHTWILWVI